MTTYTAADFANIPKDALDALDDSGIVVTPSDWRTGVDIIFKSGNYCEYFPFSHAAALLIGLVQAKCEYFTAMQADAGYECCINLRPHAKELVGVVRPTPLAAAMAAYTRALEGGAA